MGKLTVLKVKNAKAGRHTDGDGLFLYVKESGARSYVLRVQHEGKRRDIGLGTADVDGAGRDQTDSESLLNGSSLMLRKSLTLSEAREKASILRKLAKTGADPIIERDKERITTPSFAEAVTEAYNAFKPGWSDRTAKAFKASLEEHANPKLGQLKVSAIGLWDIVATLAVIWTEKPVMAKKVSVRIRQVLAFAKARGWRSDAVPEARELRLGLSKQAEGGHFKAMPYEDCATFFADQWKKELTPSRAAMLFAMLTGNRSGSIRAAAWEQIDLETREWRCPATIMKGKKVAHDVALSDAAIALLERLQPQKGLRSGLVFPGRHGKPLSDMSLTKVLRQVGRDEAVHGFRTSFRTWAAEKMPLIPWNVAELAIAHKVGTSVEKAYVRAEYLSMRRSLFDGWGAFVAPSLTESYRNAVALTPSQRANT